MPTTPIAVVNFVDEEGARFGIACAGSRVLTGVLAPERALGLTDRDGITMATAMASAGRDTSGFGADPEALDRIGAFVELHVEQGRGLVDLGAPVAVATSIWPHGRWRIEFAGEANHAGTTRLVDRQDAMLGFAQLVLAARRLAEEWECVATVAKVHVVPGGVNAIPSQVTGWLDARGMDAERVRRLVSELEREMAAYGGVLVEESWTPTTEFDTALADRLRTTIGVALGEPDDPIEVPLMGTGAGHDSGILANAGIPATMLFVRNPTGVSHSPAESAELEDCRTGCRALAAVLADLAG